ncbi:hypothetical protein BGX29_011525 [Mortierella sp. GBA35]|nr:hypothetical protein BGX29_011525 [Mortierella sp. GBA35]
MTGPSTSELVDNVLIGYLYERLAFKTILPQNTSRWAPLQPVKLSIKQAYISHYYLELAIQDTFRQIGEAILRLKLDNISGVVNCVVNYRHSYKIIPEPIAKSISFQDTPDDANLPTYISMKAFSHEDLVDTRRRFVMAGRALRLVRQRQEQEIIASIKELAQKNVEVLCSSTKGINFSDYDFELLQASGPRNPMQRPSLDYLALHHKGQAIRNRFQAYADMDKRVEPSIFIIQETLYKYERTRETLNNFAVAMIAIHYLQKELILPRLLNHQGKQVDFEFCSGPASERLALEDAKAKDNDNLAQALLEIMSKKNRKGGEKPKLSRGGGSGGAQVSAGGVDIKGLTESLLRRRLVNYTYDKDLAQIRPFDKSPVKITVLELIIELFGYASQKFKDWDDVLPPPAEP